LKNPLRHRHSFQLLLPVITVSSILVIVVVVVTCQQIYALQEIAGPLIIHISPGESKPFSWGLLPGNNEQNSVDIYADGNGSEFLFFPKTFGLVPGKVNYVQGNVSIPANYSSGQEFDPTIHAALSTENQTVNGQANMVNLEVSKVLSIIVDGNKTRPASPPRSIPTENGGHQIGFTATGSINSLTTTPSTRWIATGNWSMTVNNGNLTYFKTDMTWYNSSGTAAHSHEFQNFKAEKGRIISLLEPGNKISINGVMDVGTNHRVVWKNVPSTVEINGKRTIIISMDNNATNNHFASQPILGVVNSFVLCSDIPGPNMEVLPPCTPSGPAGQISNASNQFSSNSISTNASGPAGQISNASNQFSSNSISTNATSTKATSEELTYENATLGLKLNYPSDWVSRQGSIVNPTLSIAAILFPPNDNRSTFTIGIQDLAENKITNIIEYANSTISKYRQEVNNFQPTLVNTNGTLAGNAAYEIDGSYTDTNSQERVFFEIGTLVNNKVYVFQFDSPKSISSSYLPTVSKILQSVQINSTANGLQETTTDMTRGPSIPTNGPCRNVTIDKASASGFEKDPKDYNPPEHAIDGDASTWWSNKAVPSWFRVELAEPIQTCSVEIAWNKGNERVYDFTIATSSDGQSFTDVYSGKSNGKSLLFETYNLVNSPPDTKFLKISLTGSSSKVGWVGIRDLGLLGR
jgi:hypothetical protein